MGRIIDRSKQVDRNAVGRSSPGVELGSSQLRYLLEEGAETPLDATRQPGLPPWFDYDKFTRGQRYFNANYYSFFSAKLAGLLTILAIPSILRVLTLTRQSAEPVTAFKRYWTTIAHMLRWYAGDLLEPTSSAHKSLQNVRARHNSASLRSSQKSLGRISQLDMVLTQFGFMGYALIAPTKLGLTGTDEDVDGFVHFWRVVGYLLGIDDRFNLCRETAHETRALCTSLLDHVFAPALKSPPRGFAEMSRALIEGMWAMVPFLDYAAFLSFTHHLAGITPRPANNNHEDPVKRMNLYSRILLNLQIFVHAVVLNSPLVNWFVRPYMNFQMWVTILITERFPFLAYAVFGRMEVESPMTYH